MLQAIPYNFERSREGMINTIQLFELQTVIRKDTQRTMISSDIEHLLI